MSNDSSQIEEKEPQKGHNVPLKIKGIIKDKYDIANKIIKLEPIKKFKINNQLEQAPLAAIREKNEEHLDENDTDLNNNISLEKASIEQEKKNIEEESIDTYTLMKRNVNEEMKQYRQMQIQSIQDEIERLKETAKQEGYQSGYEEGKGLFHEYSENLLKSINDLGKNKQEDLFKKRDFIIQLSLEIAEKIIGQQIQENTHIFDSLFMEVIEKITEKDHVSITINPDDKAILESLKERFEEKFKDIQRLDIHTDKAIIRGGCTIETNLGFIDATVTSKLAILKKAIDEFHEKEDQVDLNRKKIKNKDTNKVSKNTDEEQAVANIETPDLEDKPLDIPLNEKEEDLMDAEQKEIELEEDYNEPLDLEADQSETEKSAYDSMDEDEDEDEDEGSDDDSAAADDGYDLFDGLDLSDFDDTFDEFK